MENVAKYSGADFRSSLARMAVGFSLEAEFEMLTNWEANRELT